MYKCGVGPGCVGIGAGKRDTGVLAQELVMSGVKQKGVDAGVCA
jgi:hypothetical protein